MSRNYNAIHYIQENLAEYDKHFVDAVIKAFNTIHEKLEPDGCLSTSAILYIAAKKYGYDPELCYGCCELEEKQFYHAWIEINNTVIDLSIYGNVNFSPFSLWNTKMDVPYIGSYSDSAIKYGKYTFDEDYRMSQISTVEGKSLEQYMDGLPQNAMWKLACRYLDLALSKQVIDELRSYCKDVGFNKASQY